MKKFGVALMLAMGLAGASWLTQATLEAKSNYFLCHWNEGSKSYSFVKTDYSGYSNHLSNHSNDTTDLSYCGGPV